MSKSAIIKEYILNFFFIFPVVLSLGCSDSISISEIESDGYRWISGIPFQIENETILHDNRILETNNFLTFSDASSDEVKIEFAQMAERAFQEIKEAFGITTSEELGIYANDRSTKITIYSSRNTNHDLMAFPIGFILYGLDSPYYIQLFNDGSVEFLEWYYRDVKHETMHVFQWLFGLDWRSNISWSYRWGRTWPEFWFSEGIAEYISGGSFTPIETIEQFDTWRADPNHINPISVIRSDDTPLPDSRIGEYYPMFGLAVRYLLDDAGLGKTFYDVKEMYLDMRTTSSFRQSFETYMGISAEYYEEHFFELIEDFLD